MHRCIRPYIVLACLKFVHQKTFRHKSIVKDSKALIFSCITKSVLIYFFRTRLSYNMRNFQIFADCELCSLSKDYFSLIIDLIGMGYYSLCQITQTVLYGQLTEHYYKQFVPAGKMLNVFISNFIRYPLGQEFYKLREYISQHSI